MVVVVVVGECPSWWGVRRMVVEKGNRKGAEEEDEGKRGNAG